MKSRENLKEEFKNLQKPDETDFSEWIDSYWHKDEPITKEELAALKSNIATVNKEITKEDGTTTTILGNTYTKEYIDPQIDALKAKNVEQDAKLSSQEERLGAKLDKPLQDGSWVATKSGAAVAWSDATQLGKNIANSDQTTTQAGSLTQAYAYSWNTAGLPYKITGLSDKSTDSSFFRFLVQDGNGQIAYSDGAFSSLIKITTPVGITTATTDSDGSSQRGKTVEVDNSGNDIIITVDKNSVPYFECLYIKLGTGKITFQAGTGVTLTLIDGTTVMNGSKGSRALLSRVKDTNEFLLYITNN